MKQILFEFRPEVCLGVVHHESQQIGVCQRVLLVERQEEVLSDLVLGIQLYAHDIAFLIGKSDLIRGLSDANRLELFVHVVDASGEVQHECTAVFAFDHRIDYHAHIPPISMPSSSDSSSSRNSSRDLSLSK